MWDTTSGREIVDDASNDDFYYGARTASQVIAEGFGAKFPTRSPDGQLTAEADGTVIRIRTTSASKRPDLVRFQESGLLQIEDRKVVWGKAGINLVPLALAFGRADLLDKVKASPAPLLPPAQHYRDDELAALSNPNLSAATVSALRLQFMARTCQWRAARAWWMGGGNPDSAELRRPYLTLLLSSAADRRATAVPSSLAELTAEISANLTQASVADSRVSLPLAQHVLRMAAEVETCPEREWQKLVSKIAETTPRFWQEGVTDQAVNLRDRKEMPVDARTRLDDLIRRFRVHL